MIIDCHYHLLEKAIALEDLIQRMNASNVDRLCLMGCQIDVFAEPPVYAVNVLQYFLHRRMLRKFVKPFIAGFTEKGIKLLDGEHEICTDPDNAAVFQAVENYPDRLLGWVFVNPKGKKDPVEEFEKYKDHPGFIGVKAHPFWNHHTPLDLLPVAEKLVKTGKPLIVHLGYDKEGDVMALSEKVPGLKIILCHAGFPYYADTWKEIKDKKNIFVDLSQTSYVGDKVTKDVVKFLGKERCVFGTDGPYGFYGKDNTFDYGFIKRRIERLFPDIEIQKRLLGENFMDIACI